MTPEQTLHDKLRKIEALFAGAATVGEKAAAGAAADRIRDRLGRASGQQKPQEMRFSISDAWSRQLFIALCRRYGIRPYRHRRMHRQTVTALEDRTGQRQEPPHKIERLSGIDFRHLLEDGATLSFRSRAVC